MPASARWSVHALFLGAVLATPLAAQRTLGARPTDSGGVLPYAQAAYDVQLYDLALAVDPAARRIDGTLTALVRYVQPAAELVLDLDAPLAVERVVRLAETDPEALLLRSDTLPGEPLGFARGEDPGGRHRLRIALGRTAQPNETVAVRIHYGGIPREAPRPPWVGGFTWSTTAAGAPWFATAVQNDGADLWWPCKDHPSDEPDRGMGLRFTVPEPLVAVANGQLVGVSAPRPGQRTYAWRVRNPINNYGVALAAAPYVALESSYASVAGVEIPVTFWVLPEHEQKGLALLPQLGEHLRFYEELLGPYPFRDEKYGVVETPFLGMEHQTVIAYGANFEDGPGGFDFLHHHELGHEWWGNLVTAADWRDFWIHEGFCSYMQALYAERLGGREAYRAALAPARQKLRNVQPLAPRTARTTTEVYFLAPDYTTTDGDTFNKGVWLLHGLRYLLGDDAFFRFLRRTAYPTPEQERATGGRQTRFVGTDDVRAAAEAAYGRPLDWYFAVYAHQPALPRLVAERVGDRLRLRWETPDELPFRLPVEVALGAHRERLAMEGGHGELVVPAGVVPRIDPDDWLLAELDAARLDAARLDAARLDAARLDAARAAVE